MNKNNSPTSKQIKQQRDFEGLNLKEDFTPKKVEKNQQSAHSMQSRRGYSNMNLQVDHLKNLRQQTEKDKPVLTKSRSNNILSSKATNNVLSSKASIHEEESIYPKNYTKIKKNLEVGGRSIDKEQYKNQFNEILNQNIDKKNKVQTSIDHNVNKKQNVITGEEIVINDSRSNQDQMIQNIQIKNSNVNYSNKKYNPITCQEVVENKNNSKNNDKYQMGIPGFKNKAGQVKWAGQMMQGSNFSKNHNVKNSQFIGY